MIYLLLFATLTQLPDGPGKDALMKLCQDCHDLDTVTQDNRTKEAWRKTILKMVDRGAEGTDEQFEAIVSYLAKNFGRINVNTAPAAEIAPYLGFTDKEAEAIVQYREKNGAFKDWKDLKKVDGLDSAKVEAQKNRIGVQ